MLRAESERAPIEPRPMAIAKAGRDILEIDAQTSHNPLAEEEWNFAVQKIGVLNERMLRSKDSPSVVTEINLRKVYEQQVTANRLDIFRPETGDEKFVNDLYRGVLFRHTELFYAPVMDAADEIDELKHAEAMVKEYSTDAAEVYGDETYYNLLVRSTYGSPQNYADRKLSPLRRDNFREVASEFVGEMRRVNNLVELRAHGIDDEEARILTESYLRDDKVNPDFREKIIDPFISNFRKVHYLHVGKQIERFWGEDALESLSNSVKGGIVFYRDELDGLEG
jgi:hypothetical protein